MNSFLCYMQFFSHTRSVSDFSVIGLHRVCFICYFYVICGALKIEGVFCMSEGLEFIIYRTVHLPNIYPIYSIIKKFKLKIKSHETPISPDPPE